MNFRVKIKIIKTIKTAEKKKKSRWTKHNFSNKFKIDHEFSLYFS